MVAGISRMGRKRREPRRWASSDCSGPPGVIPSASGTRRGLHGAARLAMSGERVQSGIKSCLTARREVEARTHSGESHLIRRNRGRYVHTSRMRRSFRFLMEEK